MINFEEELAHFKPSLEVEEVEDAIVGSDLTDMADLMVEMIQEGRKDPRKGRGAVQRGQEEEDAAGPRGQEEK